MVFDERCTVFLSKLPTLFLAGAHPGIKGAKMNALEFFLNHPLNMDHKLRAFFRIVAWQLKSIRKSHIFEINWVNDSKFLAKKGETGVTGNIYAGLHEFSDMAFLLHFLRPEDRFIDVGANSGSYTILAAKVIGSKVVSFEPLPSAYQRLLQNLELNRITDMVFAHNIGIGQSTGVLKFTDDLDTMNRIVFKDYPGKTREVPVMSLDEVVIDFDPILMKIDVEGFEFPVLVGATKLLRQPNLLGLIIEFNGSGQKYGFSDKGCLEILESNGFLPYSYSPYDRKLVLIGGSDFQSGNVIFLREPNEAILRVANSPKFQVLNQLI